jgi:hypothetical protein
MALPKGLLTSAEARKFAAESADAAKRRAAAKRSKKSFVDRVIKPRAIVHVQRGDIKCSVKGCYKFGHWFAPKNLVQHADLAVAYYWRTAVNASSEEKAAEALRLRKAHKA